MIQMKAMNPMTHWRRRAPPTHNHPDPCPTATQANPTALPGPTRAPKRGLSPQPIQQP